MKRGKRIVIKPFQKEVRVEPDFAENSWAKMRTSIIEICKRNTGKLSFEELYRTSYNLCMNKHGDILYNGVSATLRELFGEIGTALAQTVDEEFLSLINSEWQKAKVHLAHLRDILMYMDRTHVAQNSLTPVYDLGFMIFRDTCLHHDQNNTRTRRLMLSEIQRERVGETIDRSLIKAVSQMLIDLGVHTRTVYEATFENAFIQESRVFYKAEAIELIGSNPCPIYLQKAEQRLQEETLRTSQYLHEGTGPRIEKVVEKVMIAEHITELIEMENSGAVAMLRDNKVEDLKRMYSLFARVPDGLTPLHTTMYEYVLSLGTAISASTETSRDPMVFVNDMLTLKSKYDAIISAAFDDDRHFINALNKAFESFMNKCSQSPEYLSLFVDEKLRKGLKGTSEEETEHILDRAVMLFRFIQEKDTFERYYKQHLAKRLLYGRSVSDEAESRMLSKLKLECGFQFTSKLEGMFKDMKISQDHMDAFKTYLSNSGYRLPLDLNVHVLTTGSWPTQRGNQLAPGGGPTDQSAFFACKLPDEILQCTTIFERFYLSSQHTGRRLNWHTMMGTADLKTSFAKKTYFINVSTHAMVVLLLFNSTDGALSYNDIMSATELNDDGDKELTRTLQSLSCAKYKILNKEPADKKVSPTDLFTVNKKFSNKLIKFKISTVILKENENQRAQTLARVQEDRKPIIEACIVRIMKARKTLSHETLVNEVITQMSQRFRPTPQIIKTRIESLIDRDYLTRSQEDNRVYHYSA